MVHQSTWRPFCGDHHGDILFAKITPCVENGKVARISGLDGSLGLGSTEFHAIRPAENTDGDYLYFLMSSGMVHGLAVSLMEGTTGRQRIPASIFKRRLSVPMPSDKQEQRRIAAILSKVDEAIAKKQASIAAAQKLKRGLMQNLLTGKLKPDGTWRCDDEFDIDPKFGRVPKGWQIRKLCQLGQLVGGATPSTSEDGHFGGDIVWLAPSDLTPLSEAKIYISNSAAKLTAAGFKSCSTKMLPKGAICMSSRATLGECAIAAVPLCTNQGFISIVCNPEVDNRFLLYWIKQNASYINRFSAGTTFLEIPRRTFGRLQVCLPTSEQEQARIADMINAVDRTIVTTQASIAAAQKLKRGLMQNLLTGKVRIPPDLKIE